MGFGARWNTRWMGERLLTTVGVIKSLIYKEPKVLLYHLCFVSEVICREHSLELMFVRNDLLLLTYKFVLTQHAVEAKKSVNEIAR